MVISDLLYSLKCQQFNAICHILISLSTKLMCNTKKINWKFTRLIRGRSVRFARKFLLIHFKIHKFFDELTNRFKCIFFAATKIRYQKETDIAFRSRKICGFASIRALDVVCFVQWTCSCNEFWKSTDCQGFWGEDLRQLFASVI